MFMFRCMLKAISNWAKPIINYVQLEFDCRQIGAYYW